MVKSLCCIGLWLFVLGFAFGICFTLLSECPGWGWFVGGPEAFFCALGCLFGTVENLGAVMLVLIPTKACGQQISIEAAAADANQAKRKVVRIPVHNINADCFAGSSSFDKGGGFWSVGLFALRAVYGVEAHVDDAGGVCKLEHKTIAIDNTGNHTAMVLAKAVEG